MAHPIFRTLGVLFVVTAMVAACGRGIRVAPVAPPAPSPVSQVVIELAPEITRKKERVLRKHFVMEAMGVALRQSIAVGGPDQLVVVVKGFRTGHWGPTIMDVVARVITPDGEVRARYSAKARSMAGSPRNRIQRVAQKVVRDLVDQMPR